MLSDLVEYADISYETAQEVIKSQGFKEAYKEKVVERVLQVTLMCFSIIEKIMLSLGQRVLMICLIGHTVT